MLFEKIELEANEIILSVVRKHWFVILTELLATFVMVLAPFFILAIATVFPQAAIFERFLTVQSLEILTFLIALWLLFSILVAFTIWTHYYLDLWVITDRRIIVIDQIHFFNRKVSSFRLERLQDIKVSITGILPTLLNFGTMHAQTASAAESNFTSSGLPDPRGLQSIIQKAMDERLRVIHGGGITAAD
jgi:Bacterial PH domain